MNACKIQASFHLESQSRHYSLKTTGPAEGLGMGGLGGGVRILVESHGMWVILAVKAKAKAHTENTHMPCTP